MNKEGAGIADERDPTPRSWLVQRHERCVGIQGSMLVLARMGCAEFMRCASAWLWPPPPQGSLVRMVEEANGLSRGEIYARRKELLTQVGGNHLPAEALRGRTITVPDMTMDAVDRFQAIINPPEGAIIAARRIRGSPWSSPNALRVRLCLTLRSNLGHRALGFPAPFPSQTEVRSLLGNPDANGQNCCGGQQALLREVM